MANFKNTLKGLRKEYDIEEMMIKNAEGSIIFWGEVEGFYKQGFMEDRRQTIENSEVKEKTVFNNNKLYIVVESK